MQRRMAVLLAMLILASMSFAAAFAQNPHFINASASGPDDNGDLTVSFKEAGVGNNQLIKYVASADATATYACMNKGGGFPSDPKKQTVTGPVSTTGKFNSGKNGSIDASLLLTPPPSSLKCPPGQKMVLVSVSYSNVEITDTTHNVSESISGTFSRTFFTLP